MDLCKANVSDVTVPPRWIVEPTDVSVERNRHVALHCQAQGVPTPTIVWKKATGETIANKVTLLRNCLTNLYFYLCVEEN